MYMDMAQLSLTSTKRKMNLLFCVHYKFQALLLMCIFQSVSSESVPPNFGSLPLFYCNAGLEVEGTRLKLVIETY